MSEPSSFVNLSDKQRIGLAVLAGFLQMFSLPNMFFAGYSSLHGWIALFSFIPYFLIWRRSTWLQAFSYAAIMGFIYFVGVLSWIRLLSSDTNVDNAIAWIFFAICGGIYFGCFGASTRLLKNRLPWPDALILPLGWVAWEYLRGHILTGGWPWASLGHTQYSNAVTRQLASVVGVGGLSFLIILVNLGFTNLLESWLSSRYSGTAWHFPRFWENWNVQSWRLLFQKKPWLTFTAGTLIVLWVFLGLECLGEVLRYSRKTKHPIKLSLIQANINTRQRWNKAYRDSNMERMTKLHNEAVIQKPDIVVWAESCYPGILGHPSYKKWEDQLRSLIKAGQIPTLLTSNEYIFDGYNRKRKPIWRHFNSAFYLAGSGQTLGQYRKIHLVPFGEYIPYNFLKAYMHSIVREPIPVDFEPGRDYTIFSIGPVNFSVFICYEDVFEELGYRFAKNGSDFFLCVGNNSWSGKSSMSTQHNIMSSFLAVEHRAYIAKADMAGPTCVIDPWGNIGDALPYFTQGVKTVTIYPKTFDTYFSRHGNLIPFLFTFYFFSLFVYFVFRPQPGIKPPA